MLEKVSCLWGNEQEVWFVTEYKKETLENGEDNLCDKHFQCSTNFQELSFCIQSNHVHNNSANSPATSTSWHRGGRWMKDRSLNTPNEFGRRYRTLINTPRWGIPGLNPGLAIIRLCLGEVVWWGEAAEVSQMGRRQILTTSHMILRCTSRLGWIG